MKTRDLQTLWWDWLGTSERLIRVLYEQTAALTLRDIQRIERLQPELEMLLERMKETDERAATCAKRLAEGLGTEPNLRGLVSVLEKAEAQQVQALANRVTVAGRNIERVIDKNRVLIESELVYVNGTLTFVAKAATRSRGPFKDRDRAVVLVDEAA